MSVKTRDWLKFGALVAMAFALGLAFASAFKLPARGEAAVRSVLQDTSPPRALPQAKAAVDLGDAFASVAEHVKPAVVFIKSERRERVSSRRLPPGFEDFFQVPRHPQIEQGSGSGFIVSQDGYILTNNHVVQGADRVTIRLYDNREFTAKTIGTDPNTDIAVIKIQTTGLPTVRLGDADRSVIGVSVLPVRQEDAEDVRLPDIKGAVVQGFTTDDAPAKGAGLQEGDIIIAIDGQPVESVAQLQQRVGFKKPGETVQVTVARKGGARKTIPVRLTAAPGDESETADANDERPSRDSAPSEQALGISLEPLSQEDARDAQLSSVIRSGGGLVVTQVSPDGPAYERLADAGNGGPDIILRLNGQPTRTRVELHKALATTRSAQSLMLTILSRTGNGWQPRVVRLRRQ